MQSKSKGLKYVSNTADYVVNTELLPFASSVGRWIEMGLELTPYGAIKGAAYKGYSQFASEQGNISPEEMNSMGNRFLLRSAAGAAYFLSYAGAIALSKSFDEEEDKEKGTETGVKGTYRASTYQKKKVEQLTQPEQSIRLFDTVIPISVFGNMAIPLMLFQNYQEVLFLLCDDQY